MAHRRKPRRGRRRGRLAPLLRIVSFLLIVTALAAAMTLFFRVKNIEVIGNERYSREEVIAASAIETEENLFLINKYGAAMQLYEKLPYVERRSIRRVLPDTVVITVGECTAAAAIPDGDGFFLISSHGKLLEQTDTPPDGCTLAVGAVLYAPKLSERMSFGEGGEAKTDKLLELLDAARERGLLADIGRIELSDDTALRLTYLSRFTVKLPWSSSMDYKLQSLTTVVGYLEDNETGEINLMSEGKASFIPSKG